MSDATEAGQRMNAVLQRQKAAHLSDGAPSAEKRIEWHRPLHQAPDRATRRRSSKP